MSYYIIYYTESNINDFKSINDTYGHAEGDAALVIIAESMKKVVNNSNFTLFLGRYGGDEFIMIVQTDSPEEIDGLIDDIRRQIISECKDRNTPYTLSIGAGYDRVTDRSDSLKDCIKRADSNMYIDKEKCKNDGRSTNVI